MKVLRSAAGALWAALIISLANPASAAETTLRWQHPDPASVSGFSVHIGHASGSYEPDLTVTLDGLQPDADGIYSVTIQVEPDRTMFVAVRAFNAAAQTSDYSNEGSRYVATPLGLPGRPRLNE
jgi:hypothetical protein